MDEYIKKSEAIKAIRENRSNMAIYTVKAIRAIEDLPSADVVPKSEVVREIFGEIEKYYCINKFGEVYVHFGSIEEIKKKYMVEL